MKRNLRSYRLENYFSDVQVYLDNQQFILITKILNKNGMFNIIHSLSKKPKMRKCRRPSSSRFQPLGGSSAFCILFIDSL